MLLYVVIFSHSLTQGVLYFTTSGAKCSAKNWGASTVYGKGFFLVGG